MKSYDYIIAGAGSAGAIIAGRLAEDRDAKVLLTEQGPPNTHLSVRMPAMLRENFKPGGRYMRWYPTVPQKGLNGRVIEHPRGIGLGGSSLVNGMVFLRGHPLDYERWAGEGADGWSYAHVLPYFKRLEGRAEGSDAWRGGSGPLGVTRAEELHPLNAAFLEAGRQAGYPWTDDVNGFQQEGFCRFDMNVDKGMRSSSGYAFIEKRGGKPNLDVRTGVTARRIVIERGRAVGIELKTRNGIETAHAEREVIVSGGAVGSPQLLLLSGIGPADELREVGIASVHDLPGVGRNLHDHLEIDLQWECKEPISYNRLLRLDRMALIGIEWLLFRSGFAAKNQAHVGSFIRSGPEVPHPNIQFHFFPVCFNGWVPLKGTSGFRVGAGPMRQTSRGRLALRSADPLALPILDPNYLETEHDLEELRASYAAIQEIVSQQAFERYLGAPLEPKVMPRSRADIDELIRNMSGSGFHLCGTCKMGRISDPTAVVDPQLRVRGLEGLRVADASIMPSVVSANLNCPSMMIGERASDLIRGKGMLPPENAPFHRPEGAVKVSP